MATDGEAGVVVIVMGDTGASGRVAMTPAEQDPTQ
jgi:hypothetical protein